MIRIYYAFAGDKMQGRIFLNGQDIGIVRVPVKDFETFKSSFSPSTQFLRETPEVLYPALRDLFLEDA